jgi:hypothetical protein
MPGRNPKCFDPDLLARSESFFGKNGTRKRTKRRMKETSRTMKVTTMRRMVTGTRNESGNPRYRTLANIED